MVIDAKWFNNTRSESLKKRSTRIVLIWTSFEGIYRKEGRKSLFINMM